MVLIGPVNHGCNLPGIARSSGDVDRVPGGLHGLAVRLPLQAGHSLLHSGRHLLGSHAHSSFGMHTRV